MKDTELYRHLLGIGAPWTVSRVELGIKDKQVDVWADHEAGVRWACPDCKKECALHDHSEERSWRHLDSCQFKTFLHARPPRVRCPEHGVRQVTLPWAEPHGRFTALFERLAIDVLLEAGVSGAVEILRISWDEAWRIQQKAVERGLRAKQRRVVPTIGVDEKAAAKGHRYLTVVCNLAAGTVEYVGFERKRATLDAYYKALTKRQLDGIEAVAMDMWEPFINSTLTHLPDASSKIVFDRYHVMTQVGKAVDTVRKREHRELQKQDDSSLTGTKYIWLYGRENLPDRHRERFEELRTANLKTGRAWSIKESLRDLWDQRSLKSAERYWQRWYFWATHSQLPAIVEAARTIQRHITNVLTYFDHPITNALTEAVNGKIQAIKKMACGYRNQENFKTAIFFHCGGLRLYPAAHGNP